ncbi:MAG TPA: EAL domain-containing protein [Chloroflexota bacterium]|nr:EAL domain-containing protein [Chloroflexota bacterium]
MNRHTLASYACALLLTVGAVLAWRIVGTRLDPTPLPLFFVAVALSALMGLGPTIVASVYTGGAATVIMLGSMPLDGTNVLEVALRILSYLLMCTLLIYVLIRRAHAERQHARLAQEHAGEARFRLQYHVAPTPIMMWKRAGDDWVLEDYNPAAAELTKNGLTRWIGRTAREMYATHPDILEAFSQCCGESGVLQRDLAYNLVTTGEYRHLVSTFAVLPPDHLMIHMQDITALKQAEHGLRAQADRMAAIVTIQQEVERADLEPDIIAALIVERARAVLQADGAAIAVREGAEIVFTHAIGASGPLLGRRQDIASSMAGNTLLSGATQRSGDIRSDTRIDPALLDATGLLSLMCVPLTGSGPGTTVLIVGSCSADAFSDDDQHTLEILAGFFGSAVGHAADYAARRAALEALGESEERYRRLVELSPDPIAVHAGNKIVYANSAAAELMGALNPSELIGLPALDIVYPEDRERARVRIAAVLETGGSNKPMEERFIRLDGRVIDVEVASAAIVYRGKPALQTVVRDVTDRKRAEAARRASESRFRTLFSSAAMAINVVRSDGRIVECNPAFARMLGYPQQELSALLIGDVTHPEDRERDLALHQEVVAGRRDEYEMEKRYLRKDGTPVWVHLTVSGLPGEDGRIEHTIGIAADITERKRTRDALLHQALHDALTGLPNRSLLQDRLQQAILTARREGESVALLLIDLDRFKDVNDTYGHQYGDLLLQQAATRLKTLVRESDTVARLGGDEFAIILPASDASGAERIGHRVIADLGRRFDLEDQVGQVGVSIGIAVFPAHGDDARTLIQHADVAMYAAKRSRRGLQRYNPAMDRNRALRLSLASDLHDAIDNSDLVLHYQPQIALATGKPVGLEALVRWKHPQHGLVPPDQFIPLAEETGLINALTRWVLRAAVHDVRSLCERGFDLALAVNLSPRALHDPRLLSSVRRLLAVAPPSFRLVLEITESAIMDDPERAVATLNHLHGYGIRLAVDDFGTGYSSLGYLKDLPLDEIKIDKSFVCGRLVDAGDRAIVRAITELGHTLGLQVVAEGVEDERSLLLLSDLGCDVAQGYYFSHPMPFADVLGWLDEQGLNERQDAAV